MAKTKNKSVEVVEAPVDLKLDLGCGRNKVPGFHGVDLYSPDADTKLDLLTFPWPWADESVIEIHASHFIEHIDQEKRWPFFEECWRVLKPGGIMRIFVPNWKSERAYGDNTHKFPPFTAFSLIYLNKDWREANKLTYGPYALKCNFDNQAGPAGISPTFTTRSHEAQIFACSHYLESYQDMWAVLTKKPM